MKNSEVVIKFSPEFIIREINGEKTCTVDITFDVSRCAADKIKDFCEVLGMNSMFYNLKLNGNDVTTFVTSFDFINSLLRGQISL